MNQEQNVPSGDSETNGTTGKKSVTTGSDAPPQNTSTGNSTATQDDYYAVDYAKKEVLSTIGDGEMHDEGLVGTGEASSTDIQSSTERLSDEQDEAESHDSEQ